MAEGVIKQQPWCGVHSCHPSDCWPEHNPEHDRIVNQQLSTLFEDRCEHGVPISQQCVPCNHEYLQYIGGDPE